MHELAATESIVTGALRVNPRLRVFQVSATRGDGVDAWTGWLRTQVA